MILFTSNRIAMLALACVLVCGTVTANNPPCASGQLPIIDANASTAACLTADKAVDDIYDTSWVSDGGDRQWLEINLDPGYYLDYMTIKWDHEYSRKYKIFYFDGVDYIMKYDTIDGMGGIEVWDLDINDATEIWIQSFEGDPSVGAISIKEVKVFGYPVGVPPCRSPSPEEPDTEGPCLYRMHPIAYEASRQRWVSL